MIITFTTTEHRLRLIDEALATQIRLIDAYINKDRDQEVRLAWFRQVKSEVEQRLLES